MYKRLKKRGLYDFNDEDTPATANRMYEDMSFGSSNPIEEASGYDTIVDSYSKRNPTADMYDEKTGFGDDLYENIKL